MLKEARLVFFKFVNRLLIDGARLPEGLWVVNYRVVSPLLLDLLIE